MKVRVFATVLAGFEELLGANAPINKAFYKAIFKAAGDLAGGRTGEFARTLLAVAVYMLGVVSGFVWSVLVFQLVFCAVVIFTN